MDAGPAEEMPGLEVALTALPVQKKTIGVCQKLLKRTVARGKESPMMRTHGETPRASGETQEVLSVRAENRYVCQEGPVEKTKGTVEVQ